jgi:hypothetical protein
MKQDKRDYYSRRGCEHYFIMFIAAVLMIAFTACATHKIKCPTYRDTGTVMSKVKKL